MRLTFMGANATVTGSRHLVQAGNARVLVDCGLFQGYKPLRLRNWAPFPMAPASLDTVVLTHAHLDHSGYLPRLVASGFRGSVWCTPATADLCAILLPDSGGLLEEEALHANRRGSARHQPALPLYTEQDARRCLKALKPIGFGREFEPAPGVHCCFSPQGHILGAAAVALEAEGQRLVFSGDVGRPNDLVMRAPAPLPACDWVRWAGRSYCCMSSPRSSMSPMATDVTALYERYPADHRLDGAALQRLRHTTRIVNSAEESKALNRRGGPMIIVAALSAI